MKIIGSRLNHYTFQLQFLFSQFHCSKLCIFAIFIKKESKRHNLSTEKKIKLFTERDIFI